MKVFGFTLDDWIDIYRLYVHEKDRNPKNLAELKGFWFLYPKDTPKECADVLVKLSACDDIPVDYIIDMLDDLNLRVIQASHNLQ